VIFSATMVETGKAAPDLFLKAAAATAAGLYGTLNAAAMAMQQGGTSGDRTQSPGATRPQLPRVPRDTGAAAGGRRAQP